MASDVGHLLVRWTRAGLIDEATASRIRAFEQQHAGSGRLRWPILVALAFGGLLVAAGILLFVSAHWDTLSPAARFALVLVLVAGFHIAGAVIADRFPAMAATLHAIGTVALGAGIFLAGQIFNLDEHWPAGLMLWTLGAAIAWILLAHTAQLALVAILMPAWLAGEWFVATRYMPHPHSARVVACGLFLLALTYFTVPRGERPDNRERALLYVGGVSLLPMAAFVTMLGEWVERGSAPPGPLLSTVGWGVTLGLPLLIAVAFRGRDAWANALAAAWAVALVLLRPAVSEILLYAWWALGAVGLVAWGLREARRERINMGAAIFAATVIAFYFSEVMDKLGRAVSLVGFGLLFLGGGWALERVRRRLIQRVQGHA